MFADNAQKQRIHRNRKQLKENYCREAACSITSRRKTTSYRPCSSGDLSKMLYFSARPRCPVLRAIALSFRSQPSTIQTVERRDGKPVALGKARVGEGKHEAALTDTPAGELSKIGAVLPSHACYKSNFV
jgi:hypothetical protein